VCCRILAVQLANQCVAVGIGNGLIGAAGLPVAVWHGDWREPVPIERDMR
jgi:hypothetical protein